MPDIFVAKEHKKKKVSAKAGFAPGKKKQAKPKVIKEKTIAEMLKSRRTTNPLASLIIRPENLTFETQETKEEIILLARRHIITNLKWILITMAMILLPEIVFRIFSEFFSPLRYRSIILLTWYLLTFSYAFQHFLGWFFNVNIITDERIVDIDFPSLLYRDISSAKIDMVQDISVKMGGFIRSLFNYGDVHIQTAAEQREFIFEAIPQPERVIEILNQLILEEEQEKIEGRVR